jgi:hypothetical protein
MHGEGERRTTETDGSRCISENMHAWTIDRDRRQSAWNNSYSRTEENEMHAGVRGGGGAKTKTTTIHSLARVVRVLGAVRVRTHPSRC